MTEQDAVVAAARTRIGDAYVWGGTGPDSFDCSGLCVWAYAQIGMVLPRTSQQQAVGGRPVARDELEPGDLIIYYPDASHVALYSGNGNVITASTYGVPVEEVPIDNAGPYNCARRYLPDAPVPQEAPVTDTLFADVSEFQAPVDDSYPYSVLSIRVCDGTYVDHNFAANYAWMRAALDSGKLTFGIVYTYVRPATWQSNAATVKSVIDANGGLHPRVALMLDVESGDGNGSADQSDAINSLYNTLADYAGNPARVIGYANAFDFANMWPNRPAGLRVIGAGYPTDPHLDGEVAHQYTDGTGFGSPLPQGCPPFGSCDMNSADGLDADQFAAACGITTTTNGGGPLMALSDDQQQQLLDTVLDIQTQLRGPNLSGWPQLGQNTSGQNLTVVDALAAMENSVTNLLTFIASLKEQESKL